MLPLFRTIANDEEYQDFVDKGVTQAFSAPCEGRGTACGGGVVALLKTDFIAIKRAFVMALRYAILPHPPASGAPSRREPLCKVLPYEGKRYSFANP